MENIIGHFETKSETKAEIVIETFRLDKPTLMQRVVSQE